MRKAYVTHFASDVPVNVKRLKSLGAKKIAVRVVNWQAFKRGDVKMRDVYWRISYTLP